LDVRAEVNTFDLDEQVCCLAEVGTWGRGYRGYRMYLTARG
jgi:hypothetical protein